MSRETKSPCTSTEALRRNLMTDVHDHFVTDCPRGCHVVMVDLVSADFRFAKRLPRESDHRRLERMVRRRCASAPAIRALIGVIEPSLNIRKKREWWQLEVHALALVRASSQKGRGSLPEPHSNDPPTAIGNSFLSPST